MKKVFYHVVMSAEVAVVGQEAWQMIPTPSIRGSNPSVSKVFFGSFKQAPAVSRTPLDETKFLSN